MAKSKSKIPVRRPFSEEKNTRAREQSNQLELRRISSDLTKQNIRNNDENSVQSLDLNNTNLRVRRFTVTVKDSKGEFVKRRQSYKLTYDQKKDGGDEYEIEKEITSDSFVKSGSEKRVLNDLSNGVSLTNTLNDSISFHKPKVLPPVQVQKQDKSPTNLSVSSNIFQFTEFETSKTIVTDDTSLPVFDDDSSGSNIPLGDTYTVNNSRSLINYSPVSGTTIRLLSPKNNNVANTPVKSRPRRKIAKVKKAETFASKVQEPVDNITRANETELRIIATPVSKEGTSYSLPPSNFKANLFNRVKKLSAARRPPKFSPVFDENANTKYKHGIANDKKKNINGNAKKIRSGITGKTFVKESAGGRIQTDTVKSSKIDKTLKRDLAKDSSKMFKDEEEEQEEERYESMDLDNTLFLLKPKRHRRNLEVGNSSNLTNKSDIPHLNDQRSQAQKPSQSGLKSNSAILNKPVLKTSVKSSQNTQGNTLLSKNHIIESSSNDIFTLEDKKSRLKQAQYITGDLKIVKNKLKDSGFVAQHLDSKMLEMIQKKTVLNNLNKSTLPKENGETKRQKPHGDFGQSQTTTEQTLKPYNSKKEPDTATRHRYNSPKALNVDQSNNKRQTVQSSVKKDLEQKKNVWQVQPKIHRYIPKKIKPVRQPDSETESEVPYGASTVASWILHSANSDNKKEKPESSLSSNKLMPQNKKLKLNERRKIKQAKRMKRKESINTLSTTETFPNLINAGMYLPIGMKKLKRRPKRLRPRLYTQVGKVKGYENTPVNENSEIPVLYDDDDEYPEPRPLTDTADRRLFPNYRRYEGENDKVRINYRDAAHKKIGPSSGALIRVYKDGDKNYKGLPLTINSRNFRNFQALLIYLNTKIPMKDGINHIFKWPEKREVTSIKDFRNRCVYVVSSTRKPKNCIYGESLEGGWSNKQMSAGKVRKDEVDLFASKGPMSPKNSPVRNAPLVVTIINNLSRDKREKVILNPQTKQTFEQWMEDIANPDLPVKALYSEKAPYMEVKSFSHLFRELRTNCNFIACGEELKPMEVIKKRQAPSSNSSTDSIGDTKNRKKKLPKQQEMGQIYENGRAESPSSTAMSRYDTGPRYQPLSVRGRPRGSRHAKKDIVNENVVKIDINGETRDFYPPTEPDINDDGGKPDRMLKCEWVYGYRGKDAQNLMVLPKTGELVYYVAAVVVLYDKERDVQRHYIKHNEEVTCMTMHPNEYLIATGQLHGRDPEHASHIRIWHGESLSTYFVIGLGVFSGGVLSINFSAEEHEGKRTGRLMCVLDSSEKHVLSVWDLQKERVIAKTTTTSDPVHSACFYPEDKNNSILVSYGAKHVYFWKIFYDIARKQVAKILRDRNSGIFEEEVPQSVNCISFLKSGDVVTGDTSGNLMIWERDQTDAFRCANVIPAHNGAIMSLCLMEDGTLLSASGNEIIPWDAYSDFSPGKSTQIPKEAGYIRTIVAQTNGGRDGRFYIGTANSAILEGSLIQERIKYILEGHSDSMWGVVSIPKQPYFVSAGFDQVVYKWSQGNHKVIWRTQIEAPCTSLAINHRLETIAVGTAEGTLVILNSYNGMHIATVQVVDDPIGCLAFSRDLTFLAMGCHDGTISILKMPDKQTFNIIDRPLKGHKSGVSHIDWSKDGRWLQSSSFDNELMFWDFYNMQQIKIPKGMRDVDWYTNTCHMAYSLIGPWSNMEKGEFLRVVDRSHPPYNDLCVTGDSKGRIRLYKNPCTKEKAEYRSARIYSSDVTAVAFTSDNTGVLSCGGNDAALVQWELVDEPLYQYN